MLLKMFNVSVGTMNDLLVFYGSNVIRDRPCGLDLSQCQYKVARIEGLEEISMLGLRRCIRREFDRETVSKNLSLKQSHAGVRKMGHQTLYGSFTR
jgi:hypothetical protein